MAEIAPVSVSDLAFKALSKQDEKKPIYYRALADIIMSEGRIIPGRDPGANLISHLSRDNRFVRTDRGTYGLTEWGLKPAKKTRRPRKKRG